MLYALERYYPPPDLHILVLSPDCFFFSDFSISHRDMPGNSVSYMYTCGVASFPGSPFVHAQFSRMTFKLVKFLKGEPGISYHMSKFEGRETVERLEFASRKPSPQNNNRSRICVLLVAAYFVKYNRQMGNKK